MSPLKPYLIRAIYEWIVDNDLTPHLLVDAEHPGATLPLDYADNGRIVLNIRPQAVQSLNLGNSAIEFSAKFGGKPMHLYAPTSAVLAIYAKENGRGMVFDPEDEPPAPPEPEMPSKPAHPHLRVVK
jgi:stringent starvation protein B